MQAELHGLMHGAGWYTLMRARAGQLASASLWHALLAAMQHAHTSKTGVCMLAVLAEPARTTVAQALTADIQSAWCWTIPQPAPVPPSNAQLAAGKGCKVQQPGQVLLLDLQYCWSHDGRQTLHTHNPLRALPPNCQLHAQGGHFRYIRGGATAKRQCTALQKGGFAVGQPQAKDCHVSVQAPQQPRNRAVSCWKEAPGGHQIFE